MRLNGTPVVNNVLIAHPHAGLAQQWAGYGHIALTPGHPSDALPLPSPEAALLQPNPADSIEPAPPSTGKGTQHGSNTAYVLADQYWMRLALAGRKIDLDAMRAVVAGQGQVEQFDLAMPRLRQLLPFGHAAELSGWHVEWLDSAEREPQIAALLDRTYDDFRPGNTP